MSVLQSLSITIAGAKFTYELLGDLILSSKPQRVLQALEFNEDPNSVHLCRIFDDFGSDKGSYHGYHKVYSKIISSLPNSGSLIVEVGIGTNNTDVASHMGKGGRPGASLRAWKELANVERVIGLDVDDRILFTEPNIQTFHLDQTDANSWRKLESEIARESVDLFIDDGLHAPYANLSFLKHAKKFVKPNGYIVVEDISEQSLPIWNLMLNSRIEGIELTLYKANLSYILVGRLSKQ